MGRVRLLTCVIVDASDPSLSNELAVGTALYCTVSKREEVEKEKKEKEEERRGRCIPGLMRWSPSRGASALRERWCRTQGGCLAFLRALAP